MQKSRYRSLLFFTSAIVDQSYHMLQSLSRVVYVTEVSYTSYRTCYRNKYQLRIHVCYTSSLSYKYGNLLTVLILNRSSDDSILCINHSEIIYFRYHISSALCVYVAVCVYLLFRLQPHRSTYSFETLYNIPNVNYLKSIFSIFFC